MKIKKMFDYQKNFNNRLETDPSLNSEKISSRKNLQFQINLGELARETFCANYLKDAKVSIDVDAVYEKYFICLSEALSLGIDRNFDDIEEIEVLPNDYCLSDQFLNLFIDISDLISFASKDNYETLLSDLLSLGLTLGYSEDLVCNSFMA